MKKLISLAVVVVMIVCMALTAFAAPADQYPQIANGQCTVDPAKGKAFIMIEPNEVVTVNVPNGTGSSVSAYGYHGDDFIEGGYSLIISKINQIQSSSTGEAFGKMVADSFVLQNLTGDTAYVIVSIDTTGAGPVIGTWDKPDTLKLGTNTANVQAESDGYFYTFVAETSGVFTITMPSGQWAYFINNITASKYGNRHLSTERPIVRSESINVHAGDRIQVMVSTLNPANEYQNPAGTITFTATLEQPVHTHDATRVAAVAADCTNNGNIEYWYCAGCEGYWKDAALTQPANATSVVVPAGHNYISGTCTACGDADPDYNPNEPTETLPTNPTETTVPTTSTEPTTPGGSNSNTGDPSIIGAVAGAIFSMVGAVAVIIKKKEF